MKIGKINFFFRHEEQQGEGRFGYGLTVHEPVAVGGEVCLPDDEVEVGDDLDDCEQRAVAVDAVYPDHRGVVGDLVVDHNPVNFALRLSVINQSKTEQKGETE